MGLFKSLKGNHPPTIGGSSDNAYNYNPPSGNPPPQHQQNNHTQYPAAEYVPPFGPPPKKGEYLPPSEPPPRREEYHPPAGPPPSHTRISSDPPPYHDWTVIPDTSLLPPPPELGHDSSPSGNASTYDADRAKIWCQANPLIRPHQPTQQQYMSVHNGDVQLIRPFEYKGDLHATGSGIWKGKTRPDSKESCLLTSFPLYFACADSPLMTEAQKMIYFEVKIRSLDRRRATDESSLAIGYCSIPFPAWRMPGWERGSLGVHGDDGRKYINDSWGGKDFTTDFKEGDIIGLGIAFSVPDTSPEYTAKPMGGSNKMQSKVEVFMTRNGKKEGGWNLHEETDASNDLGVDGLEGDYDLYGALGIYGGVEFEVYLNSGDWLWRPN